MKILVIVIVDGQAPADMKSRALNITCVDTWEKVSVGILRLIDEVISTSFLNGKCYNYTVGQKSVPLIFTVTLANTIQF